MVAADRKPLAAPGQSPDGWQLLGHVATGIVADLHRQRQVAHLCQLGVRPVYEALAAVQVGADLDDVLAHYAALSPDLPEAAE